MIVIGLTGFAGAGKSTVANYLVEAHGFTRLSFAAPLKKMLRTLDPFITHQITSYSNRLSVLWEIYDGDEQRIKDSGYGPEYRRLMQVLATECIRAVDEDFWVKAAVAQMADPEGRYVFDDVRFPNEAQVIHDYPTRWNLWNVTRPGYAAVNGHASEKFAGNMGEKFVLLNSTDVNALHGQIDFGLGMSIFEPAS